MGKLNSPGISECLHKLANCLRERRLPDRLVERFRPFWEASRTRGYRLVQRILSAADCATRAELRRLCAEARAAGDRIDLSGIQYGPAHWEKGGVYEKPYPYYFFLAGFVRNQGARRIVEIGTWQGGSILSMLRGLPADEAGAARLATVDIADHAGAALKACPQIARIIGDANDPQVLEQVRAVVGSPIDLLYVDGDHRYEPTMKTLTDYGVALDPHWVILDDIHLGWSMEKVWTRMLWEYRGRAFDAGAIAGRMGNMGQGFGGINRRGA